MTKAEMELRIIALEAAVAELRKLQAAAEPDGPKADWWKGEVGRYADDPGFEEAVRLGREWRESFRPKPRKRRIEGGPPPSAKSARVVARAGRRIRSAE